MPQDAAFLKTVAELERIYARRNRDAFEKRKPTHTILKKNAMRRFALTGKTSDHFWGMRPFTPEERVSILTELLKQQRQNPFFHLYFLRDDDAMRDVEIACYQDLGILILDSNTDYNLAAGHAEAMITHPEFMRIFKEFILSNLLRRDVLPAKETEETLLRLIQLCTASMAAN